VMWLVSIELLRFRALALNNLILDRVYHRCWLEEELTDSKQYSESQQVVLTATL